MPRVPHEHLLKEKLTDPEIAAAFLNAALETGDAEYIRESFARVFESPSSAAQKISSRAIEDLRALLDSAHLRLRFEPNSGGPARVA